MGKAAARWLASQMTAETGSGPTDQILSRMKQTLITFGIYRLRTGEHLQSPSPVTKPITCSAENLPSQRPSHLALKWLLVSDCLTDKASFGALCRPLLACLSPAIQKRDHWEKNPFLRLSDQWYFEYLCQRGGGISQDWNITIYSLCTWSGACNSREHYLIPKTSSCGVATHCLIFLWATIQEREMPHKKTFY